VIDPIGHYANEKLNMFAKNIFNTFFKMTCFTKSLYLKSGVRDSLEYTLFHEDPKTSLNEALFWGFEYYDSGFQDECIDYLIGCRIPFYMTQCEGFLKFAKKKGKEWKKTRDPIILATLVKNILSTRIHPNARRFLGAKPDDVPIPIDVTKTNPRLALQKLCKYKIHVSTPTDETVLEIFRGSDWLYYTKECPIWNNRVSEFGGKYIDDVKKVSFENTDKDQEEEFFQKYGYEPDEQSVEIYEKCIGYTKL